MTTPRSTRPRTAVATVVHHEHEALLGQVDGLSASTWPPDLHVVLSVSDRELTRNRLPIRSDRWETEVPRLQMPTTPCGWHHRAMILALDEAATDDVDVLVFLDVRSIPAPDLLQAYAELASEAADGPPTLVEADVLDLLPPGPLGYPVSSELSDWTVTCPDEEDSSGPDACPASFAVPTRHWEQVRDTWKRLGRDGAGPLTPADVVLALGGSTVRAPLARVYRQHVDATTARYIHGRGDQLIDEATGGPVGDGLTSDGGAAGASPPPGLSPPGRASCSAPAPGGPRWRDRRRRAGRGLRHIATKVALRR